MWSPESKTFVDHGKCLSIYSSETSVRWNGDNVVCIWRGVIIVLVGCSSYPIRNQTNELYCTDLWGNHGRFIHEYHPIRLLVALSALDVAKVPISCFFIERKSASTQNVCWEADSNLRSYSPSLNFRCMRRSAL